MSSLRTLCLALLLPLGARAHDPGLSTVRIVLRADAIELEVAIPWADSESGLGPLLGAQGFRLRLSGELRVPRAVETRRVPGDRLELRLLYTAEERRPLDLELESRLLAALPFGHKQFVRVLAADHSALASGVLSAYSPSLRVELP